MKKLLVLFFVAAMCVPSYGAHDILVYTTSATATYFDLAGGTRSVETEKGFLVIDIDLATQIVDSAQHVTYGGSSQQTADVTVDFHDDVPNYIVAEFETADYDAEVYGTARQTDVGFGTANKKLVATSLSGHLLADLGSGIVNATLDIARTKTANAAVTPIDDVVEGIVDYLVVRKYYYPLFLQTRIDNEVADHPGAATVLVPAGTWTESLVIDDDNFTLKSVSGKAVTIIAPGAAGQGVIKIGGEHVTIDGFTIRHGTKVHTALLPDEHTIWVHANYSTIKNCTIIGAGGNQACIFIGDRDADAPTAAAIWGYNVATDTTEGHIIQNNTFRYGTATNGSGEGWGIFAVKLTDDCLIKGNTFNGDAADLAAWNTNEGAPGTAIIIHSAEKGSGDYAVTIRDNTAQYVKYSWLTFTPTYPYNDSVGVMTEQPEDSTVEDVNVCYNTIHDLGQDSLHHTSGTAVTFQGEKKNSYDPGSADLTIEAGGVTIRNNTFYNNQYGVWIKGPKYYDVGDYGCVLGADNITIGTKNSIYGNYSYGVYNGTIEDNQEDDEVMVNAESNWWGAVSGPYSSGSHPAKNLSGAGNPVSDYVDYKPYYKNAAKTVLSSP